MTAAERMKAMRERRKRGDRIVSIEMTRGHVAVLRKLGWLADDEVDDDEQLIDGVHRLFATLLRILQGDA